MTYQIRILSAGLQFHSVFMVLNLAAIALINFCQDKTNAKKLKDLSNVTGDLSIEKIPSGRLTEFEFARAECESPILLRTLTEARANLVCYRNRSHRVLLPQDRGSIRELQTKILLSKPALSVFCHHLQTFNSAPLPQVSGWENFSDLSRNQVFLPKIVTAAGKTRKTRRAGIFVPDPSCHIDRR